MPTKKPAMNEAKPPRGHGVNEASPSHIGGGCICHESTGWNGYRHLPGCPHWVPIVYEPMRTEPMKPMPVQLASKAKGGRCCGHIREHHNKVTDTNWYSNCPWQGCGCPEWME